MWFASCHQVCREDSSDRNAFAFYNPEEMSRTGRGEQAVKVNHFKQW